MLELILINEEPYQKLGRFQFLIRSPYVKISDIFFKLSCHEIFRASLKEKIVYAKEIEANSQISLDINFEAKSFLSKTASLNIEIVYKDDNDNIRVLVASTKLTLEQNQAKNIINTTNYNNNSTTNLSDNAIFSKNTFGDEGDSLTQLNKETYQDNYKHIELLRVDKEFLAPPFLGFIESAKTLEFNAKNFVKLYLEPSSSRFFEDFKLLKVQAKIHLGDKWTDFSISGNDILKDANDFYFVLIPLEATSSSNYIMITQLKLYIESNSNLSLFESKKQLSILFEISKTSAGECSNIEDFYNLAFEEVEFNEQEKEDFTRELKYPKVEGSSNKEEKFNFPADVVVDNAKVNNDIESKPEPKVELEVQAMPSVAINPAVVLNSATPPVYIINSEQNQAQPLNIPKNQKEELQADLDKALHLLGDGYNLRDANKAFNLFKKLSLHSYPIADLKLGICYLRGIGTQRDYTKALSFFKLAADADLAEGAYYYAECIKNTLSGSFNEEEYILYLKKAAYLSYAKAQTALADILISDKSTLLYDRDEAIRLYKKASENGDINAVYALGLHYFLDEKEKDYQKAIMYFEIAIKASHSGAIYCLGEIYRKGLGVPVDMEKAKKFFEIVLKSKQGLITCLASESLGYIYESENLVKNAFCCFEKAAKCGCVNSIYKLAMYLLKGNAAVAQNSLYAVILLQKAASIGHIEAILELAECKLRGLGVVKNEKEAYSLASSLLATGSARAEFLVAMMLYTGKGVGLNKEQGLALLKKSAQKNYEAAIRNLNRIIN